MYVLKSVDDQKKHYVGMTEDVKRRLEEHNDDKDNEGYSKRYAPWVMETYLCFKDKQRAIDFEKYLKKGLGYVF